MFSLSVFLEVSSSMGHFIHEVAKKKACYTDLYVFQGFLVMAMLPFTQSLRSRPRNQPKAQIKIQTPSATVSCLPCLPCFQRD
jgi:hypothetical protein